MAKTQRNNFDKSSTGTDIECSCSRDTDMSRMYFEENFEVIQHSGYRTSSVLAYTDNGQLPDISKVGFKLIGTREAREKYYLENCRYYEAEDIKEWDDETLDSEILGNTEDINLINFATDKLPTLDGIEIVPEKDIKAVSSSGYSQGDYSTILYSVEDIEKLWGNKPDEKKLSTMFDHYLWDAPIYCQFVINGKEYSYYDCPAYDEYEWERDPFLAYVSKESGVPVDQLESFVPEYPEYN